MKNIYIQFRVFALLLIFVIGSDAIAQETYDPVQQYALYATAPQTPAAASLCKFTDVPVNMYAGLPSVEIPLWEIRSRQLSVPLSVLYHSCGVRVEEIAGWAGMNWSLSLPGVISRVVHGLPDEVSLGYFNNGQLIPEDRNQLYNTSNWTFQQKLNSAGGQLDLEPDVFSFNFPGYSGQFVFDVDSSHALTPYYLPCQDFRLKMYRKNSFSLDGFEIIVTDGTRYYFGNIDGDNAIEEMTTDQDPCGESYNTFTSTWLLKKIISPTRGDTITFFYEPINTEQDPRIGISETTSRRLDSYNPAPEVTSGCPAISFSDCPEQAVIFSRKISKIVTACTEVYFKNSDREDFYGSRFLNRIAIKDRFNPDTVRIFQFYYSYTGVSSAPQRLWLDSIREEGGTEHRTYSFQYYHREDLPKRDSYAQDHWGYFNGETGNQTLVPKVLFNGNYLEGAIRDVDTTKVTYGSLKRIIYPTGAYTQFDFESNDFSRTKSGVIHFFNLITMTAAVTNHIGTECDTVYSDFFEVDHSQDGTFSMCTYNTMHPTECEATVGLLDDEGEIIYSWHEGDGITTHSEVENLAPGIYRLFAWACEFEHAHIDLQWSNYQQDSSGMDTNFIYPGGGLRIKRLISFDGRNETIKRYVYRYPGNPDKSTGILIGNLPEYSYLSYRSIVYKIPEYNWVCCYNCLYVSTSSKSTREQGRTSGNLVGYPFVTELIGENGENGKIEHTYYYTPDLGGDYFPYPPKTSSEWRRGMEQKAVIYDSAGRKVRETETSYVINGARGKTNFRSIGAVKMGFIKHPGYNYEPWFQFAVEPYEVFSGWKFADKSIKAAYDENGEHPVCDSIRYYYENPVHLQLTRQVQWNSDRSEYSNEYTYPADFTNMMIPGQDPYARSILLMRDSLHMFNTVIQSLELVKTGNSPSERITGGQLTLFKEFFPVRVFPYQAGSLETDKPLQRSDFTAVSIDPSGNLKYDSRFANTRARFEQFDLFSNLLQYIDENKMKIAINWGYNHSLMITHAMNADYDAGDQYTGPGKLVTRYLYTPLVGVKQVTGPDGINTFYEYDPLGRLKLVRNHEGNIVKKIEYHTIH